jgi:hypothetical protein
MAAQKNQKTRYSAYMFAKINEETTDLIRVYKSIAGNE